MRRSKNKGQNRSESKGPGQRASSKHRSSSEHVTTALLLILFALGVFLRFDHQDDVRTRSFDESRAYTPYARHLAEKGLGELPAMIRTYNQHRNAWVYPPPMRVGYLALLAGTMRVTGLTDERAGAWLSCAVSILSLALLGVIAARFLPAWAALYGMLSLALSLPELALSRRCWQDALMGLLGLLMVWSACEITRNHQQWWHYAALVAAGSFSVLVKELAVFVYAGCVLYVFAVLLARRAWRAAIWLAAGGLLGAGLSVFCLASAAGGLSPLLEAWRHMTSTHQVNEYGHLFQGGPWYKLFWGFWILNPIQLLLWLFASALSVLPQRWLARLALPFRPGDIQLLRLFAWMTALMVAVTLSLESAQNFRYLAPIFGPLYLSAGMGLWALLQLTARRIQALEFQAVRALAAVAVLVCAIAGYQDFERVYVRDATLDLSIKMVVDSRH